MVRVKGDLEKPVELICQSRAGYTEGHIELSGDKVQLAPREGLSSQYGTEVGQELLQLSD